MEVAGTTKKMRIINYLKLERRIPAALCRRYLLNARGMVVAALLAHSMTGVCGNETGKPPHGDLDSLQQISEVVVVARQKSLVPVQQLAGAELRRLSVHSVADALRYFSGVQIKDYGGIGGLKTVNVRSLGTNHTGVFYDGIELGNAQNGVVDLGRFSIENMESIELYNGQKTGLLQSAKDYASASAVYMQTRRPEFAPGRSDHLSIGMNVGSFDTWNPSFVYEHLFGQKGKEREQEERNDEREIAMQLAGEWMSTSGRYRFHYARRDGYDTTEVRRNGDVQALRVEGNVFGRGRRGEWRAKLYLYNSERGYPGAAVREVPGRYSHEDRQWDSNVFAQAVGRMAVTPIYTLQLSGKVAYDYLHYLSDPREDVTTMYTNNHYRQTEAYLSMAHQAGRGNVNLSLSNDVQMNHLDADLVNFVYPTRWTVLSALSASGHLGRVRGQASLLHTFVCDQTNHRGGSAGKTSRLTPSLSLVAGNNNWEMRAFYKRIFRMPTLNDLYYTFIGNKSLKPEYTTQYNVGLTLGSRNLSDARRQGGCELRVDAYYNRVEDKIVAMPTSNQFRWTMMNFGLCHIYGIDASLRAYCQLWGVAWTGILAYTYNRAKDKTDPQSEFYGGQLPYIPWHSGSAVVQATYGRWAANYSFIYTGERYESSANIAENYSKPWYTSDFSLSYERPFRKVKVRLTAEVNNVFNQQYEVVQCYPMPGTNWKFKMRLTY